METLGYVNVKFGRFDDALQVSTHLSCADSQREIKCCIN